jgi:hypothetical protein
LLAGNYTEHIADLCTQGIYRGKDRSGNTIEVPVDRASLRLTGSAKAFSMAPGNFESAADRVGNTGLAQFNLALYAMDQGLPPDTYKYVRTSPRSRTDTGERVVATQNVMADGHAFRKGQVIANSPIFTADNISRAKQAGFGYEIEPDFGKRTTLVSRAYADGNNATIVDDGRQLNDQLRQLRAQGIDDATLVSHTGNYYHKARGQGGSGICGRSMGGLHATRVGMNDDDTLHWTGSWGGVDNRTSISGDEMASWMKPPPTTLLAYGGRSMPLVFPMPFERSLPFGSPKWQDFMPHFEENRDQRRQELVAGPKSGEREEEASAPVEKRLAGPDQMRHDGVMAGLKQEIYEAHQKLVKLRSDLAALREDSGDPQRASFAAQEFDIAGRLAEFQFRLKGIG